MRRLGDTLHGLVTALSTCAHTLVLAVLFCPAQWCTGALAAAARCDSWMQVGFACQSALHGPGLPLMSWACALPVFEAKLRFEPCLQGYLGVVGYQLDAARVALASPKRHRRAKCSKAIPRYTFPLLPASSISVRWSAGLPCGIIELRNDQNPPDSLAVASLSSHWAQG